MHGHMNVNLGTVEMYVVTYSTCKLFWKLWLSILLLKLIVPHNNVHIKVFYSHF